MMSADEVKERSRQSAVRFRREFGRQRAPLQPVSAAIPTRGGSLVERSGIFQIGMELGDVGWPFRQPKATCHFE